MFRNLLILTTICLGLFTNISAQDGLSADTENNVVTDQIAAKIGLNVGAKMPAFSLKDSQNKTVSSDELLKQGNLVLVFYRGAWCPFCNLYLKNLQKNLEQIKAHGGVLAAVSVENPDNSLALSKKNELNFTVLSDPNLDTARKFNIVYQLSPETNKQYQGYGIDLVKQNGTKTPDLPLSATYIINKKGEIVYAFLEPDYKKRAEPEVIISELKKLKTDSIKK